jgi:hypothetical protein
MSGLFSPQYQWLWTAALAAVLFLPIRRLIWVISVRRTEQKLGHETGEQDRRRLKSRAAVTAALLSLVFSALYVHVLFGRIY